MQASFVRAPGHGTARFDVNLLERNPIGADGSLGVEPARSRPGDHVVLRTELDVVVCVTACPQDLTPLMRSCGSGPVGETSPVGIHRLVTPTGGGGEGRTSRDGRQGTVDGRSRVPGACARPADARHVRGCRA